MPGWPRHGAPPRRPGGWATLPLAAAGALACAFFTPSLRAQAPAPVPGVVDYVGAEGLYLSIGMRQGVLVGDTLEVLRGAGADAEVLGRVLVTVSSAKRSVVRMLDPGFPVHRGDVLYIRPPRPPPAAAGGAAGPPTEAPRTRRPRTPHVAGGVHRPAATGTLRSTAPFLAAGPPQVHGRIAMDLDLRETRTSWSRATAGTAVRRFATPTTRVNLRITDLPGGWRIEAGLRGSYRYSDVHVIRPAGSFRAYTLSAVKTFERVPLQLRLGRFYDPFESYSAYWDGALVRLGGDSGPGVGVVAGVEPDRFNEGVSTDLPKITGFADFRARGRRWRYDTDVSYHLLRPRAGGLADRTFLGWSQRLRLGIATLDQRLQIDRRPGTGGWTLTQLRLRASLGVGGGVRLHGGFARRRASYLRRLPFVLDEPRDETDVGLSFLGRAASGSLDLTLTDQASGGRGTAVSGSFGYRAGAWQFLGSGRRWSGAGMTTWSFAPGLGTRLGRFRARAGYRMYRMDGMVSRTSHAADVSLGTRIGDLSLTIRALQQFGTAFSGTGLRIAIARSF